MMLKTVRLTLKPQTAGDATALFAILNDAEAMRFWNRPPITRLAVVEDLISEQQTAMANSVCHYWTAWEGSDAIGSVDLSLIQDDAAELGFLFRRDRWGLGLASEAVAAVVAHAMGSLGLMRLAAAIRVENLAAARVLEKAGFALVDRRQVTIASGESRTCAFYLLRRDQSAAANGR
ncbi:MAG TPA: GNAT family N-acetyltransferase [Rhizomicrobium sp.]|jgi:RimJ/RimL family protein N-acetyltransferase|nr:GNAT family N-acetyltransferase [Rhizomicrobium sp.]